MDIKAIAFDFFGVCVNNFPLQTGEALLNKYSINKDEWNVFVEKAADGLDTGEKDESRFIEEIIGYFHLNSTPGELGEEIRGWDDKFIVVNEELFDLIKELKNKYKVVCFSNVSRALAARMSERGLYDIFDSKFFSYEIGKTKKDSEAWEYIERELGYKPEEYLFIDDSESNIKTAQNRGWRTIHYKNDGEAEKELRELI